MTAKGSILLPGAPEWGEALRRVTHDMYHVPAYVRLDAELYGGEPAAFHYGEDERHLLMPLILRDIPDTALRDALSPYGYSAPVSDSDDDGFWERACTAMATTLREAGLVTAFVRMHPLLNAPLPLLERFGAVVHHGETVSVDLCVSHEETWRRTRRDHRNHINRARRNGTKIVFDDWNRLGEWVEVYHDNMRRVGAAAYYFFTAEHLATLHESVGESMHFAVALEGDEVVGGSTFFELDGIATGYVSSTRRAPGRYTDELLYHEIFLFCKAIGATIFHLGGGKGGRNDSLFSYKAGFSPARHPFHTWRLIADPEAYRRLVGDREPESDMFPPYR